MPWRDRTPRTQADMQAARLERSPLARHAKLPDVYEITKHIRQHVAGIQNLVANVALTAAKARETAEAARDQSVRNGQDIRTLIRAVEAVRLELMSINEISRDAVPDEQDQ